MFREKSSQFNFSYRNLFFMFVSVSTAGIVKLDINVCRLLLIPISNWECFFPFWWIRWRQIFPQLCAPYKICKMLCTHLEEQVQANFQNLNISSIYFKMLKSMLGPISFRNFTESFQFSFSRCIMSWIGIRVHKYHFHDPW